MSKEQGPAPEPLKLDEKVAAILREDIYAGSAHTLMARQAPNPRYPDDADSWAEVKSRNDLLYIAQTLIEVVRKWDRPPEETPHPEIGGENE